MMHARTHARARAHTQTRKFRYSQSHTTSRSPPTRTLASTHTTPRTHGRAIPGTLGGKSAAEVRALLKDADVRATNQEGRTASHLAACNGAPPRDRAVRGQETERHGQRGHRPLGPRPSLPFG